MKITDDMVEAACDAFDDVYDGTSHNACAAMREALEAVAPMLVPERIRTGIYTVIYNLEQFDLVVAKHWGKVMDDWLSAAPSPTDEEAKK